MLITLEKTEANYSPTTLYNDYAVSEKIFHQQSQNTARPETGKGLSYVKQKQIGKSILLFVREKNNDEFSNTDCLCLPGPGGLYGPLWSEADEYQLGITQVSSALYLEGYGEDGDWVRLLNRNLNKKLNLPRSRTESE